MGDIIGGSQVTGGTHWLRQGDGKKRYAGRGRKQPGSFFRLQSDVLPHAVSGVGRTRESWKVAAPSGIQWGAAGIRGFRDGATESDARSGELQG